MHFLRSCVSRVWNWYFSENNLYFSTSFLTWKHYQYHYFYNVNPFQVFVCFFMVYFDSVFVIINRNRKGQNEFTDSTQHEQPSLCKNINHNANETVVLYLIKPLHRNISMHILHTFLCTFPVVLTWKNFQTIKSLFSYRSFLLFSWPSGLIEIWLGEIWWQSLLGVKGYRWFWNITELSSSAQVKTSPFTRINSPLNPAISVLGKLGFYNVAYELS